jgi:hypothetical protein
VFASPPRGSTFTLSGGMGIDQNNPPGTLPGSMLVTWDDRLSLSLSLAQCSFLLDSARQQGIRLKAAKKLASIPHDRFNRKHPPLAKRCQTKAKRIWAIPV